MAETAHQQGTVSPDIRLWGPKTRRIASLVVLGVAGFFLVGALLYYGLDAAGSGWFLWVSIVVLVLALVFEAAVVATGIAREEDGPTWLAGTAATTQQVPPETAGAGAPPEHEHEEHVHIDLQCPECGDLFSVHDTGERPLHTQCPHCGAEGHVDLEQPPPESVHDTEPGQEADEAAGLGVGLGEEPEPEPEPDADAETLSLKCPACETEFEVEDTGDRPLEAICPGCGRGGKLK